MKRKIRQLMEFQTARRRQNNAQNPITEFVL